MRDIHFIALKYSENKWVKGDYYKGQIGPKDTKARECIRVETLSQFTGIVNHYNQGIYENMVLKFINKECQFWIVEYKDGCFVLRSRTTVPEYHTFYEWKQTIIEDSEVVGTIFDM
jgi:hypothetical protein